MGDNYSLILAHSNLRTDALISLAGGKKSLDDLRKELNVSSSTTSHALRELENSNLVYQDAARNYLLTNIGTILTHRLIDSKDLMETLDTFESFWLAHDLSAIPDHLLDKIGWLKDSRIISGTPINVFKAYNTIITLSKEAKEIEMITSIIIPDIDLLFDMLIEKKDVRVIATEDVLYPTIDVIGKEKVTRALEKNLELYIVRHNPKIGIFVVTDHFMGLAPYRLGGVFDWSSDLINCDKRAIEWGRALFNHYVEIAESVDVSTYDATLDPPKSDDAFEQVV